MPLQGDGKASAAPLGGGSKAIHIMEKAWLVWLAAYGLGGPNWVPQLQFISGAVDHIDSLWIKFVFLNLPLQLVLMLTVHALKGGSESAQRAAFRLALLTMGLILIHLGISLAVGPGG